MAWDGQLDAANITATAAGRQIAWEQPISLVLEGPRNAGGARRRRAELRVRLPEAARQRHARRPGRLAELQPQTAGRPIGPIRRSGRDAIGGRGLGQPQLETLAAAAIRRRRRSSTSATSNSPCRTSRRGAKTELVATAFGQGANRLQRGNADRRRHAEHQGRGRSARRATRRSRSRTSATAARGRSACRRRGSCRTGPAGWPLAADEQLAAFRGLRAGGRRRRPRRIASICAQVRLAAAPLIVASPWLNVNEPRVDAAVAGSWNQQQRRLQLDPASLTCATVAVQANNVVLAMPDEGRDGTGRHAQLPGRRGPAAAMVQQSRQAAHLATGRATPRHGAIAADGRRRSTAKPPPTWLNLAVVDATGQQFQEPSSPPGGARRLQSTDRHAATRAVRAHLRRRSMPRRPAAWRRSAARTTPNSTGRSATTWNA